MSAADLAGWTPIRIFWTPGGPCVDWARLDGEAFTDPFFEQTLGRAMRNPARLLFRRQGPIETLETFAREAPGVPPTGFIFHMSRCGSTLVAQMCAALARSIVISEAPAIDQILSVPLRDPRITRGQRIAWFRGMVQALGQRRAGDENRYFIKFDSWHVFELPLILEAFPNVPWVFLYRDPVEVMVSHQRRPGSQMIPGMLAPRLSGIDPLDLPRLTLEEYCARVLARICVAGQLHAELGNARLVNFTELPSAMWESFGDFLGIEWTPEDVERMQRASRQNSKSPLQPHTDDRAEKQREASEEIRRLAEQWLGDVYAELEAARLAASAAASARSRSRSQSFTTQSITR
jgi:hypothetical protein